MVKHKHKWQYYDEGINCIKKFKEADGGCDVKFGIPHNGGNHMMVSVLRFACECGWKKEVLYQGVICDDGKKVKK